MRFARRSASRTARHKPTLHVAHCISNRSMKYQYGEMFERLGIPGMGHQGATWCALNPGGILVLMAHQNYFRRAGSKYQYEHPKCEPATLRGPSAKRSLDMMGSYFAEGR